MELGPNRSRKCEYIDKSAWLRTDAVNQGRRIPVCSRRRPSQAALERIDISSMEWLAARQFWH